ncbi:MAG: hypothetical protein COU63_03805 [Candidatus Pacebacteria bacterium CG10_big_fil_rev_8_21_14_0_10_36_11]|nr:hypothetical protein [Candidatus Pacearchaeota archaeon]OIP73850.1 MAG: hypothetical protein AUK08_04825 [Candidatus Pacebacteria bacterium CG2_30_36_39]PIR64587.1 MAG: hypothetical protein COU63_03805 [Candidatus Pacebacteria bacterium CG10_big_fil_rev_8_21_14_0_10_36_11]PJC42895.1 MAG: hypothetical protein CO040_02055 [Candidatus Pacebacteria bacterium CG_4_9_14_0_2_um_filter_36_8]
MSFNKKTPLILVKLGGSLITNKEIDASVKKEVLKDLISQIKKIRNDFPGIQLIIGHGQGSFAHVPAKKYETMSGFINENSRLGMAIVQDKAAQLNRLVVEEFLSQEIPAVTFAVSNTVITDNRNEKSNFFALLEEQLNQGLFPITYGDVLVDSKVGCTIWSTDIILNYLASKFIETGYLIDKVIHLTEVAGFLDDDGQIIENIEQQNWPELKKFLTKTRGVDVTGGMELKIEESLDLAKKHQVISYVIAGKDNNLYKLIAGENWVGTKIY